MNPATEDERFAGDAMDCVKKRERWSAIQKQIASRVCVPRTDGIVEYYTDFNGNSVDMRDSFLLPNSIVEEFSATAVGPQLFRDAERRARTALPPLRYVGGVDISFVRGADAAVACLAVMTYPSLEVCRTFVQRCEVSEPYIASYLAFREVGPLLELVEGVREELCAASCFPQLLLVDGCGVHHPLRCGLASHLGVLLDVPTVGCAKNFMAIDGITREMMNSRLALECAATCGTGEGGSMEESKPCFVPTIGESGGLWGYAVTRHCRATKPIFISPGNRVGYAEAAALAVSMCRHRVPEPIRVADITSRDYIRTVKVDAS